MSDKAPYLCFYGDDFTGSTDALEALACAGIETVLALRPSDDILKLFPEVQAVGLAGTSRAMSPSEMEDELPSVFRWMANTGARLLHYKVCSTFDSSPRIGSIGRAMDIALRTLQTGPVPIIVGSPRLGRFVAFGNLFARTGSGLEVFRIDRHPVMCRHPVTPMSEADLRLHLSEQTELSIGLVTAIDIDAGQWPSPGSTSRGILFDTITPEHLMGIGNWLDQAAREKPVFCVGSSAVETAVASLLRKVGGEPRLRPVERVPGGGPIMVVSGSCSSVTARQIDVAVKAGFVPLELSGLLLGDPERAEAAVTETTSTALRAIEQGRSVIAYTAHGAPDERISAAGVEQRSISEREIGRNLGRILKSVSDAANLRKVAVAGGDTSGAVTQALRIAALQFAAPLSPGAPLCTGLRENGSRIEIALKGGQLGADDFFCQVQAA